MGWPSASHPMCDRLLKLEAIFHAEFHDAAADVMGCNTEGRLTGARDSVRIRYAVDGGTDSRSYTAFRRGPTWVKHLCTRDDLPEIVKPEREVVVARYK